MMDKKRIFTICICLLLFSVGAVGATSFFSATAGTSFTSSADGVRVELGTDQIFPTSTIFPNSSAVTLHNTSFIGSNSTVLMADQWNGTITGWVNTSLLSVGSPNSLGVLTIAPENNTLTKYTLEGNGAFQGFNFTNTQKADGKEDFWYISNQTGKIIIGNLTSGTSYGAVDTLTNAALDVAVADSFGYANMDAMPARGGAHIRVEEVGTLYLRNATSPWGLINTPSTATILFYENVDSDELTVVNKTVTGGIIDLTGLPLTSSFIIQTSDIYGADGTQTHWANTALLPDISSQSAVYVLPTFEADDSNELTVQSAINVSSFSPPENPSGYLWQTVSGTKVGSSNIFNTSLEHEHRYRVKIKSNNGERSLGTFVPSVVSSTVQLEIKNVNFTATTGKVGYVWNASMTENPTFRFAIDNSRNNAFNLLWNVSYRDNGTLIHNSGGNCTPTPCGVFQETIPIDNSAANSTLFMEWSAITNNGLYIGGKGIYSRLDVLMPVPLSSSVNASWLGLVAIMLLTIVAASSGGVVSVGLSSVIISVFAGILWALRILVFPGLSMAASGGIIFLALMISVFFLIGGRN